MSKIIENTQEYGEALKLATQFANDNTEGRFSLLKSPTQWRASFSYVNNQRDIDEMMVGDRAITAVKSAIDSYTKSSVKSSTVRSEARA